MSVNSASRNVPPVPALACFQPLLIGRNRPKAVSQTGASGSGLNTPNRTPAQQSEPLPGFVCILIACSSRDEREPHQAIVGDYQHTVALSPSFDLLRLLHAAPITILVLNQIPRSSLEG